jgi:uncharacterized lipoprotein YajG
MRERRAIETLLLLAALALLATCQLQFNVSKGNSATVEPSAIVASVTETGVNVNGMPFTMDGSTPTCTMAL